MSELNKNIDEIKSLYPNKWVLIGNPKMDNSELNVLSGIPILHSKDKKEVCYLGKNKTSDFKTITVIYTGTFKPVRNVRLNSVLVKTH